jgi:hypothetical protein
LYVPVGRRGLGKGGAVDLLCNSLDENEGGRGKFARVKTEVAAVGVHGDAGMRIESA